MIETKDLLIEIGTEELPPKALRRLATAFAEELHTGLEKAGVVHGDYQWYATPRRLAVIVRSVICAQEDKEVLRRGPALKAAYDADGNPTRALEGFARSCGVDVSLLEKLETDKGVWLAYSAEEKGKHTSEVLPDIIEIALNRLPIPKRMRWGDNTAEFVRPVHWVIVLFGTDVVPCTILGVTADNKTRGHRFHHPESIIISSVDDYMSTLKEAFVLADFQERLEEIQRQAEDAAQSCGGHLEIDTELLDEVTSLVEWPQVITGEYDKEFLKLPKEVLVSTMQGHQKYFPVLDSEKNLLPYFITIANIESSAPEEIKKGNERVIRPRLADAAFFWQRDCSKPLSEYAKGLKSVVFQKQLGTLYDKTERVKKLALFMADELNQDHENISEAAALAKADLLTDMVGEFPELQGTMGHYYALEAGMDAEVAQALDEQYMPRFAGGALPQTVTGQLLAIADRLDTLVGIFAIGQPPTGEKDPFGLRRSALGCLRIMIECEIKGLDLESCLMYSAETFGKGLNAATVIKDVFDFMMERLRRYYLDQDIRPDVFEAVLARQPKEPHDFNRRIHAVMAFSKLPEAEGLAAANKRISNILRQAGIGTAGDVQKELLNEKAEQDLSAALDKAEETVTPLLQANDYTRAMSHLAELRQVVDTFFDNVMVMCDDEALKNNRLAVLSNMRKLFLTTADISRLQGN